MTIETPIDTAALDAWLAEKLFGCKVEKQRMGWHPDGGPEWLFCTCPLEVHADPGAHHHGHLLGLSGNEDWAGTGLVLKAMRERGFEYDLQSYPTEILAAFDRSLFGGKFTSATHPDSLPTAVALAAEAALEAAA